jgi:hypothetical protein
MGEIQMYLLEDRTLKNEVLSEANRSRLTLHPGSTKNLKEFYWWSKMKRQIFQYIAGYTVCQQVEREHRSPRKPLQLLLIPQWK